MRSFKSSTLTIAYIHCMLRGKNAASAFAFGASSRHHLPKLHSVPASFVIEPSTVGYNSTFDIAQPPEHQADSSISSQTDIIFPTKVLPKEKKPDMVALARRRLITHQDPKGIHKWSGMIYSLSGTWILTTMVSRYLEGPMAYAEIPDSLTLPMYIFWVSTMSLCGNSIGMTLKYRQGEVQAKNGFIGIAYAAISTSTMALYHSPFAAADVFNHQAVTNGIFGICALLVTKNVLGTCCATSEVVEIKKDRKKAKEPGTHGNTNWWLEMGAYILPVAWGLPVSLVALPQLNAMHDRLGYLESLSYADRMLGQVPGTLLAHSFYASVLASMAASLGALFVTLRDKKLISKEVEMSLITLFNTPAMLLSFFAMGQSLMYM